MPSNSSWQCPKCVELNLALINMEGFLVEVCEGSKPLEINKKGMLFRDYMILLRLVDNHKSCLSIRSLLALQELLPFSIQALIEPPNDSDDLFLNNFIDEALTIILKARLRESFVSIIDTKEKLDAFGLESFQPLIKMWHDVQQVTRNIISSSLKEEETQLSLKRLKFFKDEVVEKVGPTLIKFSQTKDKETLMAFLQLIIEVGLIKDTVAEENLTELLDKIDFTFAKMIDSYQSYQTKVMNFNILTSNLEELRSYCIEDTLYSQDWYRNQPPIVQFFVEKLVKNLKEEKFKIPTGNIKGLQLRQLIKSYTLFLFFEFDSNAQDLIKVIETEKSILEWERKVTKIDNKLQEAKELDEISLLCSERRSELLVSIDQFREAFRCIDSSQVKYIKDTPLYRNFLEKEILAKTAIQDEEMTFDEVLNEYVRESVPLNQHMLNIIERQALRYKIDQLLNNSLMIKEAELKVLAQEFSKYASGKEDMRRLEQLTQLQQDVEIILDKNYPENIEQSRRLEDVRAQSLRFEKVFLEGPCREKINKLCRVINFIKEIHDYLHSQGISSFTPQMNGSKGLSSEISLKDVDWSKMDFLKKSLFFKNKFIHLFPESEAFVHKLYAQYMVYLVEQASTHGEKTDVSNILLIETICAHIKEIPDLNPIYIRRRESLIGLLKGAIQLHTSSNLTISELKTKVEEHLEKKRYLKGFSDDRTSKVNQAVIFLQELEVIALMMRRVKVFRNEDVSMKNRDMYRSISEAMKGPNIRYLPLSKIELNSKEVKNFNDYFEQVNVLVDRWESLKESINDVHCALPKLINQNQLSQAILKYFELSELEKAEDLSNQMSKYGFLDDSVQLIRKQILQTKETERALQDSSSSKKMSEEIEQFKSSSTRKELQMLIQYIIKTSLPKTWFTTPIIKDWLRIYWIYNKLTPLLFDPITLRDLRVAFTEAISSEMCNEFVLKYIRDNKMLSSIESRIDSAQKLKDVFLDCLKLTPEKHFQVLAQIRNSTVSLFSPDEDQSSDAMNRYLLIMEKIERNFSSKSNLSSLMTFEDYKLGVGPFPVPFKLEEFVKNHLREPIDVDKWLEKLEVVENPDRIELDYIKEHQLNHESPAFRNLEKILLRDDTILKNLETEVDSLISRSLFAIEDKLQSLQVLYDSIADLRSSCGPQLLRSYSKVLIWLLKETDLFDQKESFDHTRLPFPIEMVEMMNQTCSNMKMIISAEIRPFTLELILNNTTHGHAANQHQSSNSKNYHKELELLSSLWSPIFSKINQLYTRMMDAVLKCRNEGTNNPSTLTNHLRKLGFPETTIKKMRFDQIVDTKMIIPEGSRIENDLIDEEHPLIDYPKIPYKQLDTEGLELAETLEKNLRARFEILAASIDPVKSRRQSICTPNKEIVYSTAEKKKALTGKVVETKKLSKKSSDQKENEVESRGKLLESKGRRTTELSSRKQSNNSSSGHNKEEEKPQLTPNQSSNHKTEDKQLKKRKPELVKEEKKDGKSDKKQPQSNIKLANSPKLGMFETLSMKYKEKKLENKKVSFISVANGLTEKVIDDIGLRGHIDLEISAPKSKDMFEIIKGYFKNTVTPIYGHLNCRSNDVSAILDENPVWEAMNDRIGRVWLFNSKSDIEFVKENNFLPSASTLNSKTYYLFILEKLVDGKDINTVGGHFHGRKGRTASPEGRKIGVSNGEEPKSIRESKSRSIKGDRATRSRKTRHD